MPKIEFETSLKMMREALCTAQAAIGNHPGYSGSSRSVEFINNIGELIRDIDRQRPVGSDGEARQAPHGDVRVYRREPVLPTPA